jgi:hypothetical protein
MQYSIGVLAFPGGLAVRLLRVYPAWFLQPISAGSSMRDGIRPCRAGHQTLVGLCRRNANPARAPPETKLGRMRPAQLPTNQASPRRS